MTYAPFTMYEIENTISEESASRGDYASSDASVEAPATLREALDALLDGCWDNVDAHADAVIAYPADYDQNYRTGEWSATQVVIHGAPRQIARLLDLYDARKR